MERQRRGGLVYGTYVDTVINRWGAILPHYLSFCKSYIEQLARRRLILSSLWSISDFGTRNFDTCLEY